MNILLKIGETYLVTATIASVLSVIIGAYRRGM